jgi:hypothetical protein
MKVWFKDRIPSKTVVWVVVATNPSEPQSDDVKIQVYPSQMLEQMDSFLLGNLIAPQLVNKFPSFCGTANDSQYNFRLCWKVS